MPPRSPKMNRRILGFQRLVWWPKWTPASSSSRIVTSGTCTPHDRLDVDSDGALRSPVLAWDTAGAAASPPGREKWGRSGGIVANRVWEASTTGPRARDAGPGPFLRLARRGQGGLEIGREVGVHLERIAGLGVHQPQLRGVQELTLEAQLGAVAVHGVADHRRADRGQVDADLVRAPGLEHDPQERAAGQRLDELELGERVAAG